MAELPSCLSGWPDAESRVNGDNKGKRLVFGMTLRTPEKEGPIAAPGIAIARPCAVARRRKYLGMPITIASAGGAGLIAASPQMSSVRDLARRAGQTDARVLITGESGVGKDVIAHEIHEASSRRRCPLVAVNCAGFSETLLESELFGHVRGSFTGAHRDRPGKLLMAERGTLFLDEVGEMSLRMQALLLRFLEQGEIQPVGADRERQVDVRIIAATNRNLQERVAAGEFREDLLYRLRVIHIHVPPLRERPEDLRALVERLLRRAPRPLAFSDEAFQALLRHRWPGNVRELQNVVEQTSWTCTGSVIGLSDLPETVRTSGQKIAVSHERRRQIADQLYQSLVDGHYTFWDHIHPLFLERDLTRHDIRELVRRGLAATRGNYRAVLKLFGMTNADYYRFHNFLSAHACKVDYRDFRSAVPAAPTRAPALPPAS
jgi:DNA-binding NtrC family response regulator